MLHALSKNEFLELAKSRKYVGIYREFLADVTTPIAALESLTSKQEPAMLLESGSRFREAGAHSFLGIKPYASFSTFYGKTIVKTENTVQSYDGEPLPLLRNFHQEFHCAVDENLVT